MNKINLYKPELSHKDEILDMISDFERNASAMDGFFGKSKNDWDYENWLETMRFAEVGLGIPDGFVPYIQYVSFDTQGRAIGFLNLRLRLNDNLMKCGGHIGYSIRPSERRKGWGKKQLQLGLNQAQTKGIKRVLVTCKEDNEASRRIILSNGGQYENTIAHTQRYWIDMENS